MNEVEIVKQAWETVSPQVLDIAYRTNVATIIICSILSVISIPVLIFGIRLNKANQSWNGSSTKEMAGIILVIVAGFILLISLIAIPVSLYELWYMGNAPEAWVLRHLMSK